MTRYWLWHPPLLAADEAARLDPRLQQIRYPGCRDYAYARRARYPRAGQMCLSYKEGETASCVMLRVIGGDGYARCASGGKGYMPMTLRSSGEDRRRFSPPRSRWHSQPSTVEDKDGPVSYICWRAGRLSGSSRPGRPIPILHSCNDPSGLAPSLRRWRRASQAERWRRYPWNRSMRCSTRCRCSTRNSAR